MDQTTDESADLAQITDGLFGESDSPMPETPETPVVETPVAEAPAVAEVPAVETPEAPVVETPAAVVETPVVEPDEDEPAHTDGARPPQFRFRPASDPRTIEITKLLKGGFTIDEAIEKLSPAQTASPETPANDEITALETELTTVRAALDKDADEGALFGPELRKSLAREAELIADIKLAKAERTRAEQTRQQSEAARAKEQYDSGFGESSDAVMALYPDAQNADSALSKAIDADVQQILDTPNHPLRGNPEAPMILAVKHARKLGIAPQTGPAPSGAATETPATPKATVTTPEATTPRPGLTPATGAARTAPVPAQPTAAMVEAELTSKLAAAKTDEEGAGILAAAVFGPSVAANPFG